ncbi:hypothetical protein BJ912DRAFT_951367 [Pholiota molesta]|nr:hypothetical protein BJ912DRAFT_951367 [Pholiota molesta]
MFKATKSSDVPPDDQHSIVGVYPPKINWTTQAGNRREALRSIYRSASGSTPNPQPKRRGEDLTKPQRSIRKHGIACVNGIDEVSATVTTERTDRVHGAGGRNQNLLVRSAVPCICPYVFPQPRYNNIKLTRASVADSMGATMPSAITRLQGARINTRNGRYRPRNAYHFLKYLVTVYSNRIPAHQTPVERTEGR